MSLTGITYQKWLAGQNDGQEVVDFVTDTIRVMIVTSAYTPDVINDQYITAANAHEVSGAGYTAGGVTLTGNAVTTNGTLTQFTANDIVIAQNAGGFTNGFYLIIYKDTGTASTSPVIGYYNLGTNIGNVSANLDINWDSAGIIAWTSGVGDVNSFNTRTGNVSLLSSDVTGALGFTPISGNQTITLSGDVSGVGATAITTVLANTAVTAGSYTNANITVDGKGRLTAASNGSAGGVTSFNTRTGAVTLSSGDVTGAVPNVSSFVNDAGYLTTAVTSAVAGSGIGVSASTGAVTFSNTGVLSFNTRTGAVTLSSSDVTTALGFTPISGNQNITVSGDATGSGTTAITLTFDTVNSNTGAFGSATAVGTFTVNAKGLITAASNTNIAFPVASVGGTAGQIISSGGTNPALSLATTSVSATSYTNTNLTVDSFGRITAASNGTAGTVTSVSGSGGTTGLTLTGGPITSSGTLTLGGTLAIANGGTGQTSAGSANQILTTNGTSASWLYPTINVNALSAVTTYTLALTDQGGECYITDSSFTTITVPANSSVAFPVGSAVTLTNNSGASISIAITTDTMYLVGTGTTGTRTLANYGTCVVSKKASTTWFISGIGLT